MAREIKNFSGTVNTTTTIYTVPTGRYARFMLNFWFGNTGSDYLAINNRAVIQVSGGTSSYGSPHQNPYVLNAGNQIATLPLGPNQAIFYDQNGYPYSFSQIWYMGPGQTVVVNSNLAGSATYDFQVIEEY